MKNKKMIFRISALLLIAIAFFSIVLKANNTSKADKTGNTLISFAPSDTLKPEITQEKRITKVEIINGKKKVVEKIIKMRGDSIIEQKTIEKEEEDVDQGLGNNPNQGFGFDQIDPMDLDSMFGMNFRHFNIDPFKNDSLLQGFGFNFEPRFHMGFGDSFMDDDFFKNFFNTPMSPDITKHFDDFFNQNELENPLISPKTLGNNKEKGFKSLKKIIRDQLLSDGFLDDIDGSFKFELNEKRLKINGKKQAKDIYNRYKKLIEDNSGLELEDDFEYKFKNSKSLKSRIRRI